MIENQWRWKLVVLGFGFLLISSFLDNLRGPLLPQITSELGLDYSRSSSLIFIGNVFSFGATLLLARLSRRYSSNLIASGAVALGISACAVGAWVHTQQVLWIFAAGLGSAITAMGSLSNVFVIDGTPARLRSRVLSGFHSLYGFGSVAAALVVAWQSGLGFHWSRIFMAIAVLLTAILIVLMRQSHAESIHDEQKSQSPMRVADYLTCLPLVLYVLGEVGCSTWLVTYVVKAHAMPESEASLLLSGFFGVMAVSRLLVFAFSRPGQEWTWIYASMLLAIVAFAGGLFVSPYFLPLTGVFGPFFPLYLMQIRIRKSSNWQTIAFMSFALMQAGMAMMHAMMGRVVDTFGATTAYLGPMIFLVAAAVSTRIQQNRFATEGHE